MKSFLPFHPMLPGMFFLVPAPRASLLTQSATRDDSLVAPVEFAKSISGQASRIAPPTNKSKTTDLNVTAGTAEPGR